MKIKKNIYHMIFFELFFELISITIVSFGFFLGFDITNNNILIYLLIICSIVFVGIVIYCLYSFFCKTYYVFTDNSILLTKNGNIIEEICYSKIRYCEYYRFVTLLLGDSKGGNLIIYYLANSEVKTIEVSFSKRLTKRICIKNIIIK